VHEADEPDAVRLLAAHELAVWLILYGLAAMTAPDHGRSDWLADVVTSRLLW